MVMGWGSSTQRTREPSRDKRRKFFHRLISIRTDVYLTAKNAEIAEKKPVGILCDLCVLCGKTFPRWQCGAIDGIAMKTRTLFAGLACMMIATMRSPAASDTVVDCFLGLPEQVFHQGTPSELLDIMKRGEGESVVDTENGFLRLQGDGAQVSLQVVLFRFSDKRPLLAVAWGERDEAEFTHLTFFEEREGRMAVARRSIFPVADSSELRFELSREGRTVIVRDVTGAIDSKWAWQGDKFVKE
jgi:hypothetical protein